MRAVALRGAAGSLVLSALAVAPTGVSALPGDPGPPAPAPAASPLAAPRTDTRADAHTKTRAVTAQENAGTRAAAVRAADEGIRFGACAAEEYLEAPVECGTVQVPLDYADPDGRRITLTVSRVRATGRTPDGEPAARQGALVFNPGGPGASGMYFPLVGAVPAWRNIAAAYDLVGYAARGVGRSAPLSCQEPRHFLKAPTHAPADPSPSYKKERVAEATSYARGCARRAGDALAHYTSLNNARDLDVLRAALGEPRLTFMGASYGTYIGSLYATLFPERVRRMVFDSAVDPRPERIWYRNNLDQATAFERRWEDFRTWVAKHDDVYGLGRTADAVRLSYEEVRAAVAAQPAGGKVGPGQLHSAFLRTAYYDDYWPMRAAALSAYREGEPELLIAQATPVAEAAVEAENSHAVYTAVECNDAPWPTDFRVWDDDHTALARTAPFETWDNAWANLPCAFWTAPQRQPLDIRADAGSLAPTLILAAERDAATPYQGAVELRRRLGGSRLVTERGAGQHGVGGGPNTCVNAHLDAYLLTGEVPAEDTDCAAHPEPRPLAPRAAKHR
ncbi:alpha/beta hydrolase [Streptomyces uncialis]|uniref:alpha/beta hydrolase n=1 Tax=Streptomyces uncialis TaxID=1048205 RepID=UPI0038632BAC|nr:alpha/beta hydrolase [Streptomyces uncialis]